MKATTARNIWRSWNCGRLKWCPKTSHLSKIIMETKIWCPKKCEPVHVWVFMPKFTFWLRLFSNSHSINEIVLTPEQIPSHNEKDTIHFHSGYQKIILKCGQILRKSAKMCFSVVETKKKPKFKLFNNFYKNKITKI